MFRNLKKRLILLYGITSSIILSVIIAGTFLINYNQNQRQRKELFQKNTEEAAEKIRTENVINKTWMAEMQSDNNLRIYVEDNGKLLDSYNPSEVDAMSKAYIQRIKQLTAQEEIFLDRKPLYSTIMKSSVYHLGNNPFHPVYGIAILIPQDNGWLSILAVSEAGSLNPLLPQAGLFLLIDLMGVVALFLVSSIYIGKILKPLEEGQKRQTAFIAAASHELRSPLTVIKAGVSSIKDDTSKAAQFLPHIGAECDRMTRLVNDMLLLASTDAKTWNLFKEKIDLDTFLIETYDMFCSFINIKEYALSLELPEESLHTIYADKERLKQILSIFIDNAISYSAKGSPIVIRAYNQKHQVSIEVEDHGIGIPDADKNQVFERFYRADQSRNKKEHFGLGLSIAKELVELHNGEILIKDTMGGGTTFLIQLPF